MIETACAHQRVTRTTAEGIGAFRAAVNSSFVPLHVTRSGSDNVRGTIRSIARDGIHLSNVLAGSHTVERTPELIARSEGTYFKVSVMLSGQGLLIQDDREALLRPGDLAIYDTSRPYSLAFNDDFETMVVMFARSLFAVPPEAMGDITGVRICGSTGLGATERPRPNFHDLHQRTRLRNQLPGSPPSPPPAHSLAHRVEPGKHRPDAPFHRCSSLYLNPTFARAFPRRRNNRLSVDSFAAT